MSTRSYLRNHLFDDPSTGWVEYSKGSKYWLRRAYAFKSRIILKAPIREDFIRADNLPDGSGSWWQVAKGCPLNGCSGPTLDGSTNMRPSVEHDCKYECARKGLLSDGDKLIADAEFKERARGDGMTRVRAWLDLHGLTWFGLKATRPSSEPLIYRAP